MEGSRGGGEGNKEIFWGADIPMYLYQYGVCPSSTCRTAGCRYTETGETGGARIYGGSRLE